MKYTKIVALAFIGLISASHATTTVSLQNREFPAAAENGWTIVDNTGTPLANVNYAIGTMGDVSALGETADSVRAQFTALASGQTPAIHFTAGQEVLSVENSPQDSSPVYVVFFDGADVASASDFIVFEGNASFISENPAANPGAAIGNTLYDSTLLYGVELESNNEGVIAPFTAFTRGVTFGAGGGAIPEPSSALLSLVGLAFVARRRR